MRVHRDHGGRSGHPERAPGHPKLALIDPGARVDLDLIVDLPHGGPELKRHSVAGPEEFPLYMEVAVIGVAHVA